MAPVQRKHKKSYSGDVPDAVIAATSEERGKLKHATKVLESQVDALKSKAKVCTSHKRRRSIIHRSFNVQKRSFYTTRRFLFPLGIICTSYPLCFDIPNILLM